MINRIGTVYPRGLNKGFSVVYHNNNDINHNCDTITFTNTKHRRTVLLQIRTVLLISDFGPWRHEETDTSLKSLC